jgi:hypothetical protein
MILQDLGTKIGKPWIGRGDCPDRLRCAVEPEDTTGATCLARPKNAVAIYAEAPLATEPYRRVRPVAPLNIRSGFAPWLVGTVAPSDQTISWSRTASTKPLDRQIQSRPEPNYSDFTTPK